MLIKNEALNHICMHLRKRWRFGEAYYIMLHRNAGKP